MDRTEVILLRAIFKELQKVNENLVAMKKQEYDYWEAWKKAKTKEQNKDD